MAICFYCKHYGDIDRERGICKKHYNEVTGNDEPCDGYEGDKTRTHEETRELFPGVPWSWCEP